MTGTNNLPLNLSGPSKVSGPTQTSADIVAAAEVLSDGIPAVPMPTPIASDSEYPMNPVPMPTIPAGSGGTGYLPSPAPTNPTAPVAPTAPVIPPVQAAPVAPAAPAAPVPFPGFPSGSVPPNIGFLPGQKPMSPGTVSPYAPGSGLNPISVGQPNPSNAPAGFPKGWSATGVIVTMVNGKPVYTWQYTKPNGNGGFSTFPKATPNPPQVNVLPIVNQPANGGAAPGPGNNIPPGGGNQGGTVIGGGSGRGKK